MFRDRHGNPVTYDSRGNAIPRDRDGNIIYSKRVKNTGNKIITQQQLTVPRGMTAREYARQLNQTKSYNGAKAKNVLVIRDPESGEDVVVATLVRATQNFPFCDFEPGCHPDDFTLDD